MQSDSKPAKHKRKEFAEFDHDCVKGDILSRYIYFYTTFQLVYMYWLYKVIYIYGYKVQKQEHLQWRHGPEVLYMTGSVCVHVRISMYNMAERIHTHTYTEYGIGWIDVTLNWTLFQLRRRISVRPFAIHLSLCNKLSYTNIINIIYGRKTS